jgi:Tfp pilus assembly protein PilX
METERQAMMMCEVSSRRMAILERQDGVAMLTVLMLTIILTVIGLAAITTTTLELKMSGAERMRETTETAAESCVSGGVQIIQQTLANSAIPATLLGGGTNPAIAGPLGVAAGQNPLQAEILGQSDQNLDNADPSLPGLVAPNAVFTILHPSSPYTVNMDIDRLYIRPKAGGSIQFAAGYEGIGAGAAGGGLEILYRIDCYSRAASGTGTVAAHVSGVYACVTTGTSCQRKI